MTAIPHTPADVRDMGIIHSALRRDLERTRIVLDGTEPISDQRRIALAQHLLWLVHFLHVHHTDEDTGLSAVGWDRCSRRPVALARLPRPDICLTRSTRTRGWLATSPD